MSTLIEIKNLSVGFHSQGRPNNVVHSISFNIPKGKTVAIVGESGSGKTVTAMSILKLLPYPSAFHKSGEIFFNNNNLLSLNEKEIQKIRGKNITAIFQEPMTSLNPLHTIEKQINEIIMLHSPVTYNHATKKTINLLKKVGLADIAHRIKSYSHELSGGQRQRVMIAMSIANNPDLLIADEPTTALDVTIQLQVLDLLKSIQESMNMSILYISHDLAVVQKIADYICIMKDGNIVEQNTNKNIFLSPQHNYTKELISSQTKKKITLKSKSLPILKVKNLKVWFPIKKGILKKVIDYVKAVNDISFELKENQTLGIVGESGSGKTTLVMALLKLITSEGSITFDEQFLGTLHDKSLRILRKKTLNKKEIIDTLELARIKYPGSQNSLDALCKRFKINNSKREKHNALLDCELLRDVYINLLGQKEPTFNFSNENVSNKNIGNASERKKTYSKIKIIATEDELAKHESFLKSNIRKNFF